MIAHVNGIDLFYEKAGEGRPLLLVHGNGEDHTIFDEAAAELAGSFTCYAVDSRCHGQSGGSGALHYWDMAADMLAFLEALDGAGMQAYLDEANAQMDAFMAK